MGWMVGESNMDEKGLVEGREVEKKRNAPAFFPVVKNPPFPSPSHPSSPQLTSNISANPLFRFLLTLYQYRMTMDEMMDRKKKMNPQKSIFRNKC